MALAPAPYANGNSNYLYHRYNTLGTHYLTSLDCAEDCGNCGNCGGCNDRRCKMKEVSHDDEVEEITLNDYSRRDEEQSNNDYDRKNMRGDVRRNRGGEYPRRDYKTEGVCVKSVNQNDVLSCLLKGRSFMRTTVGNNPVYNVPNSALLPDAHINANNGFMKSNFDQDIYSAGTCSSCSTNCGGSCDKCKYRPNQFLITIGESVTQYQKSFSPFVLSSNGVRQRPIYLTKNSRYTFTFNVDCLSVNPATGFPAPTSEGGVIITKTNIPTIWKNVALIFTPDINLRNYGAASGTKIPINLSNAPIGLFDTVNFTANNELPDMLYLSPVIQDLYLPPTEPPAHDPRSFKSVLACLSIPIFIQEPTTTNTAS